MRYFTSLGVLLLVKRRVSALLIALCCLLVLPLPAFACGGFFSAQVPVNQNVERIILAVGQNSTTMYEQINYQGNASDFAWVLPVAVVPKLDTASVSLFSSLDGQTAPRFIGPEAPRCGIAPLGNGGTSAGAPAPGTGGGVHVYSGGTVGPFAYDVIGSQDATALTKWLQGHHYHVPDTMQDLISTYVQAHMFFLAMRLQPEAGVQDITPVKLTFPVAMTRIMIPLRMAAASSVEHTGVLVWIFAAQRFVSQNYQSFSLQGKQLTVDPYPGANYQSLIDAAVNKAGGHAFITELARPTQGLYGATTEMNDLVNNYGYVTRFYTRLSPQQMTLDPVLVPQSGLPDVSNTYDLSDHTAPTSCDTFDLWLGSLGVAVYPLFFGTLFILGIVIGVAFVVLRKRRANSMRS